MNLSPLDLENGQSGLTAGQHCVQPLHRRQSQHGVDDSFILHAFHASHASHAFHAFHAFHAWQDSGVAQRQAFLSQCRQMCTVVLFFFATWADLPCYAQGARPIPDALAAALAVLPDVPWQLQTSRLRMSLSRQGMPALLQQNSTPRLWINQGLVRRDCWISQLKRVRMHCGSVDVHLGVPLGGQPNRFCGSSPVNLANRAN